MSDDASPAGRCRHQFIEASARAVTVRLYHENVLCQRPVRVHCCSQVNSGPGNSNELTPLSINRWNRRREGPWPDLRIDTRGIVSSSSGTSKSQRGHSPGRTRRVTGR